MKKLLLLFIIIVTYSCKNDKTTVSNVDDSEFILEDEFADFVSPYDDKPECDNDAEVKLKNYSKDEHMDFPYESARYVRMNECDFVIATGTAALGNGKSNREAVLVAKVKAQREVMSLINKTSITSSDVLQMGETMRNDNYNFYEKFNSEMKSEVTGLLSGMQTLSLFKSSDKSTLVMVLFTQI